MTVTMTKRDSVIILPTQAKLPRIYGIVTSLAVQWLRLRASNARGEGTIPGWGTKILHTVWPKKKKKNLWDHL